MRTPLRWLALPSLILFAACAEPPTDPTAPPPLRPLGAEQMIATDCGGGICTADEDWPTYPTDLPIAQVRTIDTPNFDANFDLYADTTALMSCEVASQLIDAPDADGQTGPILIVQRAATCPTGPCGDLYLSARADFHTMMSGSLLIAGSAVTAVAATFLGPGGQAIRVVASRFAWGGATGAYVGWAGYNRYRVSQNLYKSCLNTNSSWFYHVTILR
jgi:hypothetical protein